MMKTRYNTKAICAILLIGLSVTLSAQEEEKANRDLNREMTLEKEYDPALRDANKVNTLPAVKEPEVKKMPIDYATFTAPADPQKEITLLPSGNIQADVAYNKRRGYLHAAGGTYLNLNGDAGYHILDTEKDQLNIFLSHRSTNGKLSYNHHIYIDAEKVKAKLNDNLGGIRFRHLFKKADFKLGANYGYTSFNYYGMSPIPIPMPSPTISILSFPDISTNQVNQALQAFTGIASREDAKVGYLLDFDYINFSRKYALSKQDEGITEHTMGAKLGLSSAFKGNQRVGIGGKLAYLAYNIPPSTSDNPTADFSNRLEGTITPYYRIEGESWHVQLGANVLFYTGDSSKLFVSPNAEADVAVGAKTVLYAKAGGELRSNSAYALSRENRYLNPVAKVLPSRVWLDAVIGLKSGIAPGFWFNLFAGYKLTGDDHFFLPPSTFSIDDFKNSSDVLQLNSTLIRGGLEMAYAYQWIEVALKGVYNNWSIRKNKSLDLSSDFLKAHGRPKMEITTNILVKPIDKVSVNLDYYLAGGRETYQYKMIYNDYFTPGIYDVEKSAGKMKNIHELNFTGSYRFNDTFGAYIKLNNLLFQKYEVLYDYPLQGFNVMAGININF
ncbi:MAG: TonB-dependent receptor [Tannerellaceae bacterium]|nr:TonB-dependent receptor [Tannerellaceae bacterium]